MIGKMVIAIKPSGTKLRGILVWTHRTGWKGIEMCTGFVERVSPECKLILAKVNKDAFI